ncbi:MAG: REP-associated tyrosine transposase [Opitutaceae bacterium]
MDMGSPWTSRIVSIYYDQLPHWVVDYGCYAITIRCAGSLPKSELLKLQEITETLKAIDPALPKAEDYQRRQFAILESYLDRGDGFAPFSDARVAKAMNDFIAKYETEHLRFSHWVVMPNHIHLLTQPITFNGRSDFESAWRSFKQSSAYKLNHIIKRSGNFWQTSWYDRWVRTEHEYNKWIQYIENNPVKAGLVATAKDYPHLGKHT